MKIKSLTVDPDCELHWQMTPCERFGLQGLLRRLEPSLSIEIGTYMGGSLQVLSKLSKRVISIDIDAGVRERLAGRFPNVEFRSGCSSQVLPNLVRELNEQKKAVGFVLVDGDHSEAGVRQDIETLLNLVPQQPLVFLLHDSFNPSCRKGMRTANWEKCPYVWEVELDFIPGIYHYKAHDTAEPRSMWGGFACAFLFPEKRRGALTVTESQRYLYEAVQKNSRYRFDGTGKLRRFTLRGLEKIVERC